MQRVPQMQMQVQINNANCKCKLNRINHPTGPRGRRKFLLITPQKLSNNNYIYTVVIGSVACLIGRSSLCVVKSYSKNYITLSGGGWDFSRREEGASQREHLASATTATAQRRGGGGETRPIAANPLVAWQGQLPGGSFWVSCDYLPTYLTVPI
jgi:hypothetical protein